MILEDKRVKVNTEKLVKIIRITKEDIKDMIIDAIQESYGISNIDGEAIGFRTEIKYVDDEWGMNRSAVTVFNGATVELPEVFDGTRRRNE